MRRFEIPFKRNFDIEKDLQSQIKITPNKFSMYPSKEVPISFKKPEPED